MRKCSLNGVWILVALVVGACRGQIGEAETFDEGAVSALVASDDAVSPEVDQLVRQIAADEVLVEDLRPLDLSATHIVQVMRRLAELGVGSSDAEPMPFVSTANCSRVYANDLWRDPSNPGSGTHVVVRFYCPGTAGATQNFRPASTKPYLYGGFGPIANWMLWQHYPAPGYHQVFVDGWYYYEWVSRFYSGATIMGWIYLQRP
jgi:hypothetical protein